MLFMIPFVSNFVIPCAVAMAAIGFCYIIKVTRDAAMVAYKVATNHIPHLQEGINDLKEGQKEQTDQLKEINRNLFAIATKH